MRVSGPSMAISPVTVDLPFNRFERWPLVSYPTLLCQGGACCVMVSMRVAVDRSPYIINEPRGPRAGRQVEVGNVVRC